MTDATPERVEAEDLPLPAGRFADWLDTMQRAIEGAAESDVPCDGCTACCTSSQFVHIGPDETAALARIPSELQFEAPGLPAGHVVLGYDERGHCPMLGDGGCSIYEVRPRTCRTYDCRVFPAAGVEPDDDKPAIALRVHRWRFDFATENDRVLHEAVRAAARHVRQRDEGAPATAVAVRAVELHASFLRGRRP